MSTLLVWLLACAGGGAPEKTDTDGDGVPDAGDCAPGDPAISPRAPEVCDGVDNNCDLLVDEGLPTTPAFPDVDGDGYGSDAGEVDACSPPAGTVPTGGDCDDHDATAFPGADEWCDGADHDCDGAVNEDDAVDAIVWSVDADGDGYGGPDTAPACALRAGLSGRDDDCDDADPEVHPDAVETCEADHIDQDCDGLVDGDDPDAVASAAWYVDADGDGDGAGDPIDAVACTPPPGYSLTGTDCDDTDPELYTRAWYPDADRDGYGDAANPTESCEPVAGLGTEGRDCQDADADIHPGAPDACGDGIDSDCNGVDCFLTPVVTGLSAGDDIGFTFAVGDFDADGARDLTTGWVRDADFSGVLRTYNGPITGTVASPDSTITGTASEGMLGVLLGSGDLDGDGVDELFATDETQRFVFTGPLPVDGLDTAAVGSWIPTRGLYPSWDVDLAGDLDGDGADDIVFGEWSWSNGSVRVLPRAIPRPETSVGDLATVTIRPSGGVETVGWAQGGSQDLDGDGAADLVMVGAFDAGHPILGYAMILYGPLSGTIDATDADVVINTVDEGWWGFGGWAWAMPDLDGDGYAEAYVSNSPDLLSFEDLAPGQYDTRAASGHLQDVVPDEMYTLVTAEVSGDDTPDLVIGAAGAGSTDNGAVYVYYGPVASTAGAADADAAWYGEQADDGFGQCVRVLGDVEGVGRDSLVVGSAWGARDPASTGAIHLISGLEMP